MTFLPLTLTASSCLAFTFVVFFVRDQVGSRAGRGDKRTPPPAAN